MTIGGQTNITYLPVHRSGKAIESPSATDINTAKQRCRVKAMGEFGLGYTMWLSSQIKEIEDQSGPEQTPPVDTNDADAEHQKVIAIWDHLKFGDAKTLSEATKLHDKFKRGLTNRGLTDSTGNWESLCKDKGWRASK